MNIETDSNTSSNSNITSLTSNEQHYPTLSSTTTLSAEKFQSKRPRRGIKHPREEETPTLENIESPMEEDASIDQAIIKTVEMEQEQTTPSEIKDWAKSPSPSGDRENDSEDTIVYSPEVLENNIQTSSKIKE